MLGTEQGVATRALAASPRCPAGTGQQVLSKLNIPVIPTVAKLSWSSPDRDSNRPSSWRLGLPSNLDAWDSYPLPGGCCHARCPPPTRSLWLAIPTMAFPNLTNAQGEAVGWVGHPRRSRPRS